MATPAMQNKKGFVYLEARPGSFYQELFVQGVNLRASRLVAWMEAEGLTPEQAAADRSLPMAAVLEAIEYVKDNTDLIVREQQRERQLLRDRGLLESALARARNAFAYGEEDIVVLAVALMAGISRAHAFEQGNKRTAFAAMRLFLRANGYDTAFDDTIAWANEVISLVERRSTEEEFALAIRPFVASIPSCWPTSLQRLSSSLRFLAGFTAIWPPLSVCWP